MYWSIYRLCVNINVANVSTIMNGRLKKIDMTARLELIKKGLDEHAWYPEWDDRQRGAAQRILNNALDVLDEYAY